MTRLRRRTLLVSAFCVLLWGALGARLWHLQVTKGEALAREAYGQRAMVLPVADSRGRVLDRNDELLTDARPAWGVAAFPALIADREGTARALSPVLGLSEWELLAKLQGRSPFWLALPVAEAAAGQVERMRLPGIVAAPSVDRYGPRSIARHLVGYINREGGMLGLEAQFDKDLRGEAFPAMVAYTDGRGRPLQGLGIRTVTGSGKPPYDVVTTIDASVQRAVEQVLDAQGPLRAGVVVMDVKSGDLLAMASRPDYDQVRDPGRRLDFGEAFLLNRAVIALEPGSVIKPAVAAEALDAGVVKPGERFLCAGHYDLGGGYKPQCALYPGGHGRVTLREALEQSCNVALMVMGYERLGADGLRRMAEAYGLGRPSPIGLMGEQSGFVPDLSQAYEAAQLSFGQGMTATPVQVARIFAAFANGGVMPPAQVVREVRAPDGTTVRRHTPGRSVRVMKAETAREIAAALAAVTAPGGKGTGQKAWVPGHGSAGKTGSAEGSDKGRPTLHAWFAGYTPLAKPRYSIVVMVQGGGGGGDVAAPLFREVAEAVLTAVH